MKSRSCGAIIDGRYVWTVEQWEVREPKDTPFTAQQRLDEEPTDE